LDNEARQGAEGGDITNAPLSWLNAVTDYNKRAEGEGHYMRLLVGVDMVGPDDSGWFHSYYKDYHTVISASARRPALSIALLMQKLYDAWKDQ